MTRRPRGRRARPRAKKSLGQNFLVDPNLQRRIVEHFAPAPDDLVLEIGPGRRALTDHLVGRCAHLYLVELDDDLAADLSRHFEERQDVTVIHADILDVDPGALTAEPDRLRVIGNIPYNITAPLLFHLLRRPRPRDALLMVQKEVAERLTAAPGGGDFGALTVGVRAVADVEPVMRVPPGAFRPVPAVESAVVHVRPHDPPRLSEAEEEALRRLTRALFQWRRKQLSRILRDHPDLRVAPAVLEELARETGWDLRRRPETFAPDDLLALARWLSER
ncbi:MAG: ribosomal RNA small subunit methyltransferase A [Gemmatimonadetes bacterium]|nr:MAG: ribosomal RNA small subunit methyltransferase A [Gemmatimonadota bacterium]